MLAPQAAGQGAVVRQQCAGRSQQDGFSRPSVGLWLHLYAATLALHGSGIQDGQSRDCDHCALRCFPAIRESVGRCRRGLAPVTPSDSVTSAVGAHQLSRWHLGFLDW